MDFKITKRLDIINNEGDYLKLESDDFAIVWTKNGDCKTVQIEQIDDNGIIAIDQNEKGFFFKFERIENIQKTNSLCIEKSDLNTVDLEGDINGR